MALGDQSQYMAVRDIELLHKAFDGHPVAGLTDTNNHLVYDFGINARHCVSPDQAGPLGSALPFNLTLMNHEEVQPTLLAQIGDLVKTPFERLNSLRALDLEHQVIAITEREQEIRGVACPLNF